MALSLLYGCVNGPVRYKTLGYFKYSTVESFNSPNLLQESLTLPSLLFIDPAIIISDTIYIPVEQTYYVLVYPFGEQEHLNALIGIVLMPVWGPIAVLSNSILLPYAPKENYTELYGEERGWL